MIRYRGAWRLLPLWWLGLLYGSLLVPFVGPLLVIVGSSIAYYQVRRTRPLVAWALNRHAFIAIGLNCLANAAIVLLIHR